MGHGYRWGRHDARPSYRKETAEEAWAKCLGWFKRYLS